uniref:Integrase catalytic domain-containing protein n=1 Tax=Nicotiana tabacum TaxID=4097 RepID=A0A1S4DRC9_TOBAC
TRVKFIKKAEHKTRDNIDYMHSDLWGPNRVPSKSGARYFMTLIDDYSRMVWVYVLKIKDQAFSTFVKWKTMVERQTKRKVKHLRTDNGLEFWNSEFDNFWSRDGIVRHRTCVGTPQQNGVAEQLEIESPLAQPSSSKVEEVEEVQNSDQDDNVDAPAQQQPYSIATCREKRVINLPQRFANIVDGNLLGYTNLVGFALAVAETVFECYSYSESIQSTEPNRQIIAMAKEIESLNKFRRCLDLVDVCGNG